MSTVFKNSLAAEWQEMKRQLLKVKLDPLYANALFVES